MALWLLESRFLMEKMEEGLSFPVYLCCFSMRRR